MDHTIDEIIEKIKAKEQVGMDVVKTPLLMIANPDDFPNARVLSWNVPKFNILLTQNGKTIAMKTMGSFKGSSNVLFMLSWIQEYDPAGDRPPCCGKVIYLFEPVDDIEPELIELDKN